MQKRFRKSDCYRYQIFRDIRSSAKIRSMSNRRPGCFIVVFFDKFVHTVSYKSNSNPGVYTTYEYCAVFKYELKFLLSFPCEMLAFRLTRHLKWHRWMNTLPCHSNTRTWYRTVLCIIITLAYRLYSSWMIIKEKFLFILKCPHIFINP
jgi:hypothetical protein